MPGRRILGLVVLAAALLPYLNAFGNELVRDDKVLIRDNPAIRSLEGLAAGVARGWWGDHVEAGLWRPLVLASWAANHALSGLATWSYTAVDLLLHAAVAALVAALALSCGAGRGAALAAGLLFAVHPVHTEAVTGFVGRADTMATLFVLLALLAHRRAARGGRAARLVTAACVAAALLSKEQAIAVLPLLPIMDWLVPAPDAAGRPAGLRRRWAGGRGLREALPLLAVLALVLLARWAVLGSLGRDPATIDPALNPLVPARITALGDVRGATPLQAALTPLAVLAEAARLLVWPARLSFDYSWRRIPLAGGLGDPRVLAGLLVLGAALAGFVVARRRAPLVAFGLALAALPYLVTANLLFPTGTIFGERLLYLPSAGAMIVAGVGWERLARGPRSPGSPRGATPRLAIAVAVLGLLVVAGAVRTWRRNADWRDTPSVTAAMVRDAPQSVLAQFARGAYLHFDAEGRGAEAVEHLRRATAICPEHEPSNRALVAACLAIGDPAGALPAYERLLRLAPDDARAHQGFAMTLLEAEPEGSPGARERAEAELDIAVRLAPDDVDVRAARGWLLRGRAGREADAAGDLRAVLRMQPGHPEAAVIRSEIARLEGAAAVEGRR